MFRSLSNLSMNPKLWMLFLSFDPPRRLRVNGTARIEFDDPAMVRFPGADAMDHVEETGIFPNCLRYIHQGNQMSPYLDQGAGAPVPEWKQRAEFADALPRKCPSSNDLEQAA